ncbi:hypothetical protein [Maritimibacter sp. HL-12]|uniref:hypothetical protein n=1 Tax=Maritimibacter sp. HL-12 TaxID=1162418 RepID=UPI000A0F3EA5|nr:hypothetical protein [Maritimibacter sp. HL-12]SMH36046.1 hypothetical protein SAMN05661107_0682 [Maritimibacter sp. HL-12]
MTARDEFSIDFIAEGSAMVAVFHKGRQVSPASRNPEKLRPILAEKRRIAARAGRAWRCCLSCGERFLSEGVHQRLCAKHRSAASAEMPDQESPSYRSMMGK